RALVAEPAGVLEPRRTLCHGPRTYADAERGGTSDDVPPRTCDWRRPKRGRWWRWDECAHLVRRWPAGIHQAAQPCQLAAGHLRSPETFTVQLDHLLSSVAESLGPSASHALAYRPGCDFGARGHAELGEHVRHVDGRRLRRDVEPGGELGVREPL